MIIRAAELADAPAMGRVMVETYLRAHKGQVPEEAWRRRKQEKTAATGLLSGSTAGKMARSCSRRWFEVKHTETLS